MTDTNFENGMKLRGFRKQNKLTQSDVARLIGKATSEVCRYEKGDFPIPDDLIDIINDTYKLSLVKSEKVGETVSKKVKRSKKVATPVVEEVVETVSDTVEESSSDSTSSYYSTTSSVPFLTKGHVSKRFGSLIKAMNMTQGEFASKFKMTKSHVFRLVNKQTTNLSVKTLRALLKAGINIVDLIK